MDQCSRLSAIEVDQQLSKLALAEGASFDSYFREHEPRCLDGTRSDLLERIHDWSINSDKQIFWLNGLAGAGKSIVCRTIAKSFSDQGRLAGSFFFSRVHGDLGHARKFVSTLVHQLVNGQPSLKSYVAEVIKNDQNLLIQGLHNQWKALVLNVLRDSASHFPETKKLKLIFVVDALDECDREEDMKLILRLFSNLHSLRKVKVQVFLTSRKETPIRLGFEDMTSIMHQDVDLGDIPHNVIQHDISVFLETEFKRIAKEHHLSSWPAPEVISTLSKRSDRLFIYAATVCRFIGDPNDRPNERLSVCLSSILENNSAAGSDLAELDKMYMRVLEHSVDSNLQGAMRNKFFERFQRIIGSFLTLRGTLSASSLAALLDTSPEEVEVAFRPFRSLFYVPRDVQKPLRVIHPTFPEFLLDPGRCLNQDFQVVSELAHTHLAAQCLRTLSTSLRRDICGFGVPLPSIRDVAQETIESCLSHHVRYACLNWFSHLVAISQTKRHVAGLCMGGAVHLFFKNDFRNWVEAMSLMGRIFNGVAMVSGIQHFLYISKQDELGAIALEAMRIISSHPKAHISYFPESTDGLVEFCVGIEISESYWLDHNEPSSAGNLGNSSSEGIAAQGAHRDE